MKSFSIPVSYLRYYSFCLSYIKRLLISVNGEFYMITNVAIRNSDVLYMRDIDPRPAEPGFIFVFFLNNCRSRSTGF